MSTRITDGRRAADDRDPHLAHAAVVATTEQARVTEEVSAQRTRDSMSQLVRRGQDTSLRSLQVWADLARRLGPTAPSFPAGVAIVALACDPFEKLLAAQRQVVDELVATQCQLAQQLLHTTTATVGGNPVP
ncbi:MAG: hypothetical protein JO063_06250 [Pseudonocardiales bacterium]|nr:hypothetical protein [Pseudonocardiales bacterium]MBV9030454.1 hypothetical protein [Pseudonocardiales bacterium]MBW0009705.1 hypothetical protein [Pseudonocardiales bacterium]